MARCDEIRERLGAYVDGELEAREAGSIEQHLSECGECADLRRALEILNETVAPLRGIEPPPDLESDIAASPCRRWLGLLVSAMDREIDDHNLQRLLGHLDACPSCTRIWTDLALVHQVGDALAPPPGLAARCVAVRRRPKITPIISRRAAIAAAYVLAVLASLVVGNPVSIARSPVVQRMASTVSDEVNLVAEEGRGEIRVMMWRAWRWGNRQAGAIREMLSPDRDDSDNQTDQGEAS